MMLLLLHIEHATPRTSLLAVLLGALLAGCVALQGSASGQPRDDNEDAVVIVKPALAVDVGKNSRFTVTFNPSGSRLATVANTKNVLILDAENGKRVQEIVTDKQIFQARYLPDGKHIVATGPIGVRIWNAVTGKEVRRLSGKPHIRCDISPMGQYLAVGHMKGATVYEISTWKEAAQFVHEKGSWYSSVSFLPSGNSVATSGLRAGGVQIWDVRKGTQQKLLPVKGNRAHTVSSSPSGKFVAVAHISSVSLFDIDTGAQRWELSGLNGNVAAISRDGHHVATAGRNHDIQMRDIRDGRLLKVLRGHAAVVNSVAFAPGGQRVASCDSSGKVFLWELSRD
jgi:WD40 repeat protein